MKWARGWSIFLITIFFFNGKILTFWAMHFVIIFFSWQRNYLIISLLWNLPVQAVNNMLAWDKHFDVHLCRTRSVRLLSKHGKDASYEGRDGWKNCLSPARAGLFYFVIVFNKVLFPKCNLTWRVKIHVFDLGRAINRRNESTKYY